MISADANEGRISDGPEHRADSLYDSYLIKPVRLTDLLEKMAALLDIQWFYEGVLATPGQVRGVLPASAKLPGVEVLQELKFMAEIGHLQGLKKRLAGLKEEAQVDSEFLQFLASAIQQVRLDKIIELAEANRC